MTLIERRRLDVIIKISAVFVLFFSLFPYLTPVRTEWDTQPWALLFSLFYLSLYIFGYKRLSVNRLWLIIMTCTLYGFVLTGFFLVLGQVDMFVMVRRIAAYMTLLAVAYVSFHEHGNFESSWIIMAVGVWLLGFVVQRFVDMEMLGPFLPRVSVRPNQGVTSFSPEPSYYAVQIAFFLLLNELFWRERRYGVYVYISVMLVLLVQLLTSLSGTSLIILVVFLIGQLKLLTKLDNRIAGGMVALFLLLSIVLHPLYWPMVKNTRPVVVAKRLEKVIVEGAPVNTITRDRSIVYRSMAPVIGVYGGLVVSRGIGFGWGRITHRTFPSWLVNILGPYRYSSGRPIGKWRWGGTIMGGLSSAVYELGIVGLLYVAVVYYIVLRAFASGYVSLSGLFLFLVITIGGFVSLAHPMFGYMIGAYASKLKDDRLYTVTFSL